MRQTTLPGPLAGLRSWSDGHWLGQLSFINGLLCISFDRRCRTWLDVWFSGLNGAVVKAIVSRDRKKFIAKAIIEFGLMMVRISLVPFAFLIATAIGLLVLRGSNGRE